MDEVKTKSSKKKKRAAVGFAGVAVAATVLAPAAVARASTRSPRMPYSTYAFNTGSIKTVQLCGYQSVQGVGHWTCTAKLGANIYGDTFGHGWRYGKFNLWVWGTNGIEYLHTCNTNSNWAGGYWYTGDLRTGLMFSNGHGSDSRPLGESTTRC